MNVPLKIETGDPGTVILHVYRRDELVAEATHFDDSDVEETVDALWAVCVPGESQIVAYDGHTGLLIPGQTSSPPPV